MIQRFLDMLEQVQITAEEIQQRSVLQRESSSSDWLLRQGQDIALSAFLEELTLAQVRECITLRGLRYFHQQLFPAVATYKMFFARSEVLNALAETHNRALFGHIFDAELKKKLLVFNTKALFFVFLLHPATYNVIKLMTRDLTNPLYTNNMYDIWEDISDDKGLRANPAVIQEINSDNLREWKIIYTLLATPPVLRAALRTNNMPSVQAFVNFCMRDAQLGSNADFATSAAGQTLLKHYVVQACQSENPQLDAFLPLAEESLRFPCTSLDSETIDKVIEVLLEKNICKQLTRALTTHQIFSHDAYSDLSIVDRAKRKIKHAQRVKQEDLTEPLVERDVTDLFNVDGCLEDLLAIVAAEQAQAFPKRMRM